MEFLLRLGKGKDTHSQQELDNFEVDMTESPMLSEKFFFRLRQIGIVFVDGVY